MVSLEIEKPSDWSIGKKLGVVAILLLIIGPFLPYYVSEVKFNDESHSDDISLFNYEVFGLWMFIPIISAILLAIILYIKFDFILEQGGDRKKIDHFILMIWGGWFFITYLADAIRMYEHEESEWITFSRYAGIGLWMIIGGLFLTALIGFLEWRYPSATGPVVPKVSLPKKKEKEVIAEITAEPAPQTTTPVAPQEPIQERKIPVTQEVEPRIEPQPQETSAEPQKIEAITREPTSEEEKTLQRWARHINQDGQTFEQCMKCKNYVFINAKDTGDAIIFECPDCGEAFMLKK